MPLQKQDRSAGKARHSFASYAKPAESNKVASLIEKKKLPVFLFPDKLLFYLKDQATHKRVLTIYNPYEFNISFKVLCTSPQKYTVLEPKGKVKAHCCSDILIRRTCFNIDYLETVDKFRVDISYCDPTSTPQLASSSSSSSVLGSKEVSSTLLKGLPSAAVEDFRPSHSKDWINPTVENLSPKSPGEVLSAQWLLILIAVLCLFALAAHTTGQEDTSSIIPTIFTLTSSQKLIAAYILGTPSQLLMFSFRFSYYGHISSVLNQERKKDEYRNMSRTFGVNTPERRSRRLLESGYYIPGPTTPLTDNQDTDDQISDTDSIDSNSRTMQYTESPLRKFNTRRRRHGSGSSHSKEPLAMSRSATRTKKRVVKELKNAKSEEIRGSISAPAVNPQRMERTLQYLYGLEDGHIEERAHPLASGEVNAERARLRTQVDSSPFKIPSSVIRSNHSRISETVTRERTSFSDFEEDDRGKESLSDSKNIFVRVHHTFYIVCSLIANLFLKLGWLLYQTVTGFIVLDTWLLTAKIPSTKSYAIFRKAALLLGALLLAGILYITLPSFIGNNHETKIESTAWFSLPSLPSLFATNKVYRSRDDIHKSAVNFQTENSVQFNINDFEQKLQKLEIYVQEMELKLADKQSTSLNKMDTLERKYTDDFLTISNNQKKVLTAVEEMIENSINRKLTTASKTFAEQLQQIQLTIEAIKTSHHSAVENMKETFTEKEVSLVQQNQISTEISELDQSLNVLNLKLESLQREQKTFQTNVETNIANKNYIQEIADESFLENFFVLLNHGKQGSQSSKSTNLRHQHLSNVFLEWLHTKGFVKQKDVIQLKNEINSNSTKLTLEFREELEKRIQILQKHQVKEKQSSVTLQSITGAHYSGSSVTEKLVKQWIQESLDVYSADGIGIADFALETSGGAIVNTRCSKTYQHKTALVSLFGIPLFYNIHTPRSVIQAGVLPGECWAFEGSEGYVVIALSATVHPTSFTLEHIPHSLALHNNISSAPKDFSVYGLQTSSDMEGTLLGSYRYNENGSPIQNYPVEHSTSKDFSFVELRVVSNWGHPDFTCIYRFRVHGNKSS